MSTSSVQRIDTAAFEDAITKIDKVVTSFSATKDSIVKSTDLLLSTWTGKGKDMFEKAYTSLKTELVDEEENLKTISEDLKAMKESYDEWDATTKGSFLRDC